MTKRKKLVLVGGGNMGEALVAGLLRSLRWTPSQITVTDVRPETLNRLKKTYRILTTSNNTLAVQGADIVLLAVKPQQIRSLLTEIGSLMRPRQLVLSIAAGVTTAQIESSLPSGVPVVRVMPNTPALVGCGAAALCLGRFAQAKHGKVAQAILETVGIVETISEKDMDAVTAVSGSGPAYVFYVAEAMKEAGVRLGLAPQVCDRLVRHTIQGAGKLLAQSADDAQTLRTRVTSPGGTTEAALQVMDAEQLKAIFAKALRGACHRSLELSKGGQ